MGRNAAFGRPPASERFRRWWDARSKTSRQNALLAVVVGGLFVAIVMAAVARDKSPATSRVISSRPQPTTTLALPTLSTVNIGDPAAVSGSVNAADPPGPNTTSTTPAPAPATTAPAPAPPPTSPPPAVATTAAPAPATTVTNPDVIYTTVPPEATTTTLPPVTTTRPAPTSSTTPTTTSLVVPLTVPAVLGP